MQMIDVETGRTLEVEVDQRCFVVEAATGAAGEPGGWVLPVLADADNHLSLASPAGDAPATDVRVRASASLELALGVLGAAANRVRPTRLRCSPPNVVLLVS